MTENPIGSVLSDRDKRRAAAQILGQAYMRAYHLMLANKGAVERVANELVERKELFGDELLALLGRQDLEKPDIDYLDEKIWPKI